MRWLLMETGSVPVHFQISHTGIFTIRVKVTQDQIGHGKSGKNSKNIMRRSARDYLEGGGVWQQHHCNVTHHSIRCAHARTHTTVLHRKCHVPQHTSIEITLRVNKQNSPHTPEGPFTHFISCSVRDFVVHLRIR